MNVREELTLMLIYLSSWEEKVQTLEGGFCYRKAWKGYEFEILNDFMDQELIGYQRKPSKSKSIELTKEGEELALELLRKYQIEEQLN